MRLGSLRLPYRLLLALVLLGAAVLRFIGLDWDDGYYLHPDERFMVMVTVDTAWPESIRQYFDTASSPLNPYNTRHGTFIYGTFPLFLTKAISTLFGHDVYGEAHLAGRALSALADTGTVFLTAWIARRFFGRAAGLLAGLLLAATMLHIQTAHYYTVDAVAVFFATATFAATVKAWDRRSFGWFAVAGLMVGLAGASKPNYLIALAFLALPVAEAIRRRGLDGLIPWSSSQRDRFPVMPAVALAGLVAFWTFRIAQPYAFAGPSILDIGLNPQWTDDLAYWQNAQSGLIDIKSSIQWSDRTPVLYILDNLVRWGMGPPLGIAALAGLALLSWRLVRATTWPSWWMLGMGGWSLVQLVLYGTNMAQAQRYLMPIYPFLVVFGAALLVEFARRFRLPAWRNPGAILVVVVVIYTLFYAVAFTTLYVRPLSREQASRWIYDNVPAGSAITGEYWDDGLPMRLPGEEHGQYRYITLDLYAYEGPGSLKLSKLIGQLNQADYIALSSNRIIGSVPRQPERYPMATHYYEMLDSGELGFELVADFSQVPELFGVRFDDTNAEETLTVYEHPYVRIYQKTADFDAHAVYEQLSAALGYGGVNYLPGDPLGDQMFIAEPDRYARDAMPWSAVNADNALNTFAPVTWYLALQLMMLPGLPFALLIARRFPDRGYALAKVLGLLLVTWLAWVAASTGIVPLGRISITLSWALALAAGLWLARNALSDLLASLRERWRWVLATEALFLAVFALATWIRTLQPAFWDPSSRDETPFWFAIFTASVRTSWFPAYDPWLSGGLLHLPNWGQMPWVTLARFTGVVPATAYNLAFAGVAALTAVTLWSAAAAQIARRGTHRALAGTVALIAPLIGVLGATWALARRVGEGFWGDTPKPDTWWLPGVLGDVSWGAWILYRDGITTIPNLALEAMRLDPLTVTHNPFAALFAANLDAATATLPLNALALAAAVAIVTACPVDNGAQWPLDRMDIGRLALAGGIAGTMLASSTWGFLPTFALVTGAVVIRLWQAHGPDAPWPFTRNAVLATIGLAAVAAVAFLPHIVAWNSTQRDRRTSPVLPLDDAIAIYGPALLIVAIWVGLLAAIVVAHTAAEGWRGQMVALLAVIGIALAFVVAIGAGNLLPLAALVMTLAIIGAWRVRHTPAPLLALGVVILAMLALVLRGIWSLAAGPFGNNPALDLEMPLYLLLGVVAAGAAGWSLAWLDRTPAFSRVAGSGLTILLIGMMIAAGAAYPVMAVRSAREHRITAPPTLDATAFLDTAMLYAPAGEPPSLVDDRNAAAWLMANADGLPVVLEATTGDYQLGGRISAMTGYPTVIGWGTPERFMRPGWAEIVGHRQRAVGDIYGRQGEYAAVAPLIEQYDVAYIYVGPIERAMYPAAALAKFDRAAATGELEVAYQAGTVTIYAVPEGERE